MKVYIETYGCQMNEYDSGLVSSMLRASGHSFVSSPDVADVVIVNTCSVRERAERRVLGRLRHLRGLAPRDAVLGVMGCVAQRMGDRLMREVRGLSFVVGTDRYSLIPRLVENAVAGIESIETGVDASESYDGVPGPTESGLRAFVSVTRGCDNFCSYCIVPYVRGRERSRAPESVVEEVEKLVALGARDVTLLGQNVNSYGNSPDGFARLLRDVNEVEGLERIRFATSHPKDLNESLLDAMAGLPKVCEHLHLPVQSGSDAVLARMNRSYTRAHYLELVRAARDRVPDIAVTTDVIVGFPGESESEFEATVSLMEEVRFDSAFMFRYSVREGTAAAGFEDDVSEAVKIGRLTEVIELQKRITTEINDGLAGARVEVLFEGPSEREPSLLFGRTRTGKAVVASGPEALAGSVASAVVERATAWTLHVTAAGEKDLASGRS